MDAMVVFLPMLLNTSDMPVELNQMSPIPTQLRTDNAFSEDKSQLDTSDMAASTLAKEMRLNLQTDFTMPVQFQFHSKSLVDSRTMLLESIRWITVERPLKT